MPIYLFNSWLFLYEVRAGMRGSGAIKNNDYCIALIYQGLFKVVDEEYDVT